MPHSSDNAMASGSDPYEQQLLAVFESCCEGEEGRALDGKGLARLCEKLHLEDQAPQLLERLLGRDCVASRQITFPQFRDALLALLAGGHKDELEGSPGIYDYRYIVNIISIHIHRKIITWPLSL